ncbi:hypothetical protein HanRHA438_Chr10g0443411 [Helianthus annuus]|nr:hypothetical protein HanRHA438_Chr10g0443411 [Helianthus annuus]
MKCRYTLEYQMTIKLNEEPNTIKIQASAHCYVVILNDELFYILLYCFNFE